MFAVTEVPQSTQVQTRQPKPLTANAEVCCVKIASAGELFGKNTGPAML